MYYDSPLMSNGATETVALFSYEGRLYELDHLGISDPRQCGEYAIYWGGRKIAEFQAFDTLLEPELQPPPPSTEDLIEMAKAALRDAS